MNNNFYNLFFKKKGIKVSDKEVIKLWVTCGYPLDLLLQDYNLSGEALHYVLAVKTFLESRVLN